MAFLHVLWVFLFAVVGVFSLSGVQAKVRPDVLEAKAAPVSSAVPALSTYSTALQSFEERCERELSPSSVSAHWAPSDVTYDFSSSMRDLSEISHGRPGNVVLGLTRSALGSEFSFGMDTLTDPQTGRICMRPQIAIRVSAGQQKISVAREFAKGSCAQQAVIDHEMQHARANDDQARFASRRIEGEIARALGNRVFYGTREELESYLTGAIKDHWMPMVRAELGQVETDHAHIDRKSENQRVLSSCNGEVVRTITAGMT